MVLLNGEQAISVPLVLTNQMISYERGFDLIFGV